ncbi:Glycosyltransferase involved in cell wall bisynthesis [Luteibacter sp. UNCMF331Sha3.1]|uniref:glycosyltransferase family 2 protein n=1 Tax=Luteibacter sp. UNCMF331Sha3.1 TaxID=1502760 RepID=UPI0008AED36A|nr:glycosyltransferase family 2 protein [Luteibacter sp. UNCMF331Sha3.1]SEM33796.1 Glycosyltransferase involved in cell wall bisynthesis [Luteibacter sp. UNCMF331Sha3.1]
MNVGSPRPRGARSGASVVLCTYNGARFLAEQLESLLAQSRLPAQIVIADDASSDETPAMVESFAERARAEGIEVVLRLRQANLGYIANFSDALRLATAEVVFLCDQDDVWHPDKLRDVLARFDDDPELSLAFTDARLVDGDGRSLEHSLFTAIELRPAQWAAIDAGAAFPVLLERAVVTGATAACRRWVVDKALPVPAGWIHDEWLATVAAMFGHIAAIHMPLIDYRQHGGNQIGIARRTFRARFGDLFRPRNALLGRAVERMAGLADRFGSDPAAPAAFRDLLARRLAHYRERVTIGTRPRPGRWPLIYAEWRRGAYARYGNGLSSVVRDILRKD